MWGLNAQDTEFVMEQTLQAVVKQTLQLFCSAERRKFCHAANPTKFANCKRGSIYIYTVWGSW